MSAKRLKPPASGRGSAATPAAEGLGDGPFDRWWVPWAGLAWLVGFCFYFYSFELPNNREDWSRPAVWVQLPELFPVRDLFSARWANLAQRADLIGVAALILAGAWGLGRLSLRFVRPPIEWTWIERMFFGMGLGLGATSLLTLFLGLVGWLNRWLFVGLFAASIIGELALCLRERPAELLSNKKGKAAAPGGNAARPAMFWPAVAVVVPFLIVMWLGSMSPESDFDVREYHFEGPKEYFQNGRITFLPHNVYTSFPFLNEMLVLLGMVLRGDWYWGALAGKCVMFAYAPLTALGLYAAGRRWFGQAAGLLAAVVYLTAPWIDRLTTIAYVEGGLAFFLFAALFAAMIGIERLRLGQIDSRQVILAGLLAGNGMACKYTGLFQVVTPIGLALIVAPWFALPDRATRLRAAIKLTIAFGVGVAITIGPWLWKNVAETGNPVYPLAYSIFGGKDLDPDLDAKFRSGHTAHTPRTLPQGLRDVVADSDWSSPLWYGLAPLAIFVRRGRRAVWGLWLFAVYLFVTWWELTHQLDRFWVPMIPVVSLLAGIGGAWRDDPAWRIGRNIVVGLAIVFNFVLEAGTTTSYLCGHNAFLTDINRARENIAHPYFAYLNHVLTPNDRVLCVGDAEVFESQIPLVYNTVFDKSIFQEWFAVPSPGTREEDLRLKPAREILDKLHRERITQVYVSWQEIRRYRSPGSYDYTHFVTAPRFDQLVADEVLGTPVSFGWIDVDGMSYADRVQLTTQIQRGHRVRCDDGRFVIVTSTFDKLSDGDRALINKLGPSLVARADGRDVLINAQLFPVR